VTARRGRGRAAGVVLGAISLVLVGACRAREAVTPSDAVMQFYTMRDAIGVQGAPSPKELAALRPFIADTLARGLAFADSVRESDTRRAPDEKPAFVEGDLFSSVFEGATSFRVMPALSASAPYVVPVEFADERAKPVVRWVDTAIVIVERGRMVVQDVRYGGTWDFANKGRLLEQFFRTEP
jgi:hypothetical protein